MLGIKSGGWRAAEPRFIEPTTTYDYLAGSAPGTFTRASGATTVNYRGYVEEVASDVARSIYDPALEYNQFSNPWFDGAGPGAVPTGMTMATTTNGLTLSRVGIGIEDGIPYFDVGISGTATATTSTILINLDNTVNSALAYVGETFCFSLYHRLMSGSVPVTRLQLIENSSVNAELANNIVSVAVPTSASLASQRVSMTRTMTNAAVAKIRARVLLNITSGVTYDGVVRIGFPALTRASTPITDRISVEKLADRVNGVPQHGLIGFLVEDPATNLISHSRDLSVAGWTTMRVTKTAGTLPAPNGALEATAVTLTTDTGNKYITSPGFLSNAVGEVFTFSVFARAYTHPYVQIAGLAGGYGFDTWATFDLSNGTIGSTGTATTAGIERHVGGWYRCWITVQAVAETTSGYAIGLAPSSTATRLQTLNGTNETVLLWGAQSERAAQPTTVVLAAVGTPAVTTRARDIPSLPIGDIDIDRSTIAIRYMPVRHGSAGVPVSAVCFSIGSATDYLVLRLDGDMPQWRIANSGAAVAIMSRMGDIVPRDRFTGACIMWGGGTTWGAFDGGKPLVDASAPSPIPVSPTWIIGGSVGTGNIIIRDIRIWKSLRLSVGQVRDASKVY